MDKDSQKRMRWGEILEEIRVSLLFGGVVAGVIVLVGQWVSGSLVSEWVAASQLESLTGAVVYLGSASVGGSTTVLALLLTILGMVRKIEREFERQFFLKIKGVAGLSAVGMGLGLVLLQWAAMPATKPELLSSRGVLIMYWGVVIWSGTIMAVQLAIVKVLLEAIGQMIEVVE